MTKHDFLELSGGVLFMVLVVLLMVLFCWLTPDQLSGEADLQEEAFRQSEEGGAHVQVD